MKVFFSIVVFSFITSVWGQTNKKVSIPIFKNYKNEPDTSVWFKWKYALIKQINLKDLQTTSDSFHFRFWSDAQAVDIWTLDHSVYFGTITNYAQRYNSHLIPKGVYKIDRTVSNQISIDTAKAREIFRTIETLSIISIPSDNKISGWGNGFDGEEFLIETSTPNEYNFKEYWTPRLFADLLKEARQIQAFVNFLFNDFKLYRYYEKLKLPEGCYRRNGIQGIQIKSQNEHVGGATFIYDLL